MTLGCESAWADALVLCVFLVGLFGFLGLMIWTASR